MVDLHVVRVAPRLGIATGTDGNKIEKTANGSTTTKTMGRRYGYVLSWSGDLQAKAKM